MMPMKVKHNSFLPAMQIIFLNDFYKMIVYI